MCEEDRQHGRRTTAVSHSTLVSGNPMPLVPRAELRLALVLHADSASDYWVWWGGSQPTGTGCLVAHGGPPLVLDLQAHGALVTQGLTAYGGGGSLQISWTEVLEMEP